MLHIIRSILIIMDRYKINLFPDIKCCQCLIVHIDDDETTKSSNHVTPRKV